MRTYEVYTDLDPVFLTEVAIETFRLWVEFALGKEALDGKTLMHPSGAYAASMSWKRTGTASVAIIADESQAKEGLWIEEGTVAHSMKSAMLGGPGTKTGKGGYRYRVIPIRKDASAPNASDLSIKGSSTRGQSITAKTKKIWTKPRAGTNADHYVVMSDRPGSSDWVVPAMPAYAPAYILSKLIEKAAND